jgi:RNA polymerase sigma-70 factor (ECF subfamily)
MTWAVTLTRHRAIDHLRSRRRRARLQEDAQREAEIFAQIEEHSSSDAAASDDARKLVHAAIQKLNPEQRQAIELAFFSSLTQSEIAERLGEPLGTIKARIRRGMLEMRHLLRTRL